MIKIKVSYECPEDLHKIVTRLGNEVISCRKSPQKPGERLRAYIEMKGASGANREGARNKQTNRLDGEGTY